MQAQQICFYLLAFCLRTGMQWRARSSILWAMVAMVEPNYLTIGNSIHSRVELNDLRTTCGRPADDRRTANGRPTDAPRLMPVLLPQRACPTDYSADRENKILCNTKKPLRLRHGESHIGRATMAIAEPKEVFYYFVYHSASFLSRIAADSAICSMVSAAEFSSSTPPV